MRDAGVVQQHVLREALDRQRNLMADYGARIEMQRGKTAVHRRVVILNSRGHSDQTRLEIADERDKIVPFDRNSTQLAKRAHKRNGQRGGSPQSRSTRGVGPGGDANAGEMKVLEDAVNQRRFWIDGDFVERLVALLVLLIG